MVAPTLCVLREIARIAERLRRFSALGNRREIKNGIKHQCLSLKGLTENRQHAGIGIQPIMKNLAIRKESH